ncbi:DUF3343 domain-containing protein [Lacrimispora sphenoides]|uniref:Putative Se/S carrier protein-like domain-containing protein n=1 Tax=Lacrimispora sphenoides JCM 1415 TaxID=1297793 RepID=A0ABY1C1L3_9FIRM|nr:DUF3343 domain-containing protein [Lacrimispora sphenoides]SET53121.1 Protein of unknown function [[Clostridium] sphenoides JCM 1415]SUY49628.1 Protein of uncharacterised function (DUF3343) [Lacrimispora sphenoides]
MRKKEQKIVITFRTTAEAIAMESQCQKEGIPGRLIPVPRQISSGCGLSWAMPVNWDGEIEKWMEMRGLRYEKYGEYLI